METWSSAVAAENWRAGAGRRAQAFGPITERMLDAAAVGPGMRVLDVAAGTGDTSLLAAQRVGASGSVLATDISASMLEVAADAAAAAGLANLETLVRDASQLTLPPRSFDAAISRNGLMFMPDLRAALTAVRGALKPGARLAAIVWSTVDRNPYMGVPIDVVRAAHGEPSSTPTIVRAFSLSAPGVFEQALTSAGFSNVRVERVPFERSFESLAAARDAILTGSAAMVELMGDVDEHERNQLLDQIMARFTEFRRPDGSCALPSESLLGSGTA
jgi:ubiquinone/menaquinone biosynthesis C-methylase UbiE